MTANGKETPKPRHLDSWIGGFLRYTEGTSSPPIFRKWAAITALGACLERRVWVRTAKGFTYANLFVLLVGRPGIGKSEAINNIRPLVKATYVKDVYPAATEMLPYDVTKGAMLDKLSQYSRWGPDPYTNDLDDKTTRVKYHSAFLAVSELGNLVREKDNQLLNSLHDLYDCLSVVEEERRYMKDKPISIVNPSVALLGGTTPSYLSETFPVQAWSQGFMARVIMIYSADVIEPDLFNEQEIDIVLAQELVKDLRQIGNLKGKMIFTDAAKAAVVAWQKSGRAPQPDHVRLEHYNTRRMRHALKLSMIAAIDKGNTLVIDVEDFQQALAWMIEAEKLMPQVFLELVGRSDGQVINELWFHCKQLWDSPLHGRRPITKALIVEFLRHRVSSWQIEQVIKTAIEVELLIVVPMGENGETRYKPNLKPDLIKKKTT